MAMKKRIISENIVKGESRSFRFRGGLIYYTDEFGYHAHPEMELMALTGGGGKRTINELTEEFTEYDVVFTPGGIPHCWVLDPQLCNDDGMVYDWCSQFPVSLIKDIGTMFPEFHEMSQFYMNLRQALKIYGDTASKVIETYKIFHNLSGRQQILSLIELLNLIYEKGEYQLIGFPVLKDINISKPRIRFHIINKLITENYDRPITLKDAADAVEMNPTAFCNAFKTTTGTTFNNFLTTYRLQVAARLLSTTLLNIGEISFKVGFNDLPHFSRTFTKHYHESPSKFRKRSQGNTGG